MFVSSVHYNLRELQIIVISSAYAVNLFVRGEYVADKKKVMWGGTLKAP